MMREQSVFREGMGVGRAGGRRWRLSCFFAALLSLVVVARAQDDSRPEIDVESWSDLTRAFVEQADLSANFTERRYFPFREAPAVLSGVVRVSPTHGLSLAYALPEERIVIVDSAGLALREKSKMSIPAGDERAAAVNRAMLHILRFDLRALQVEFSVSGERAGDAWTLVLIPREKFLERAFRKIEVSGEKSFVKRIELRRSQRQYIEIVMADERPDEEFSAEELKQYFR